MKLTKLFIIALIGLMLLSCKKEEIVEPIPLGNWQLTVKNETDAVYTLKYYDNTSYKKDFDTAYVSIPAKDSVVIDYKDHISKDATKEYWINFIYWKQIGNTWNTQNLYKKVYFNTKNTLSIK